MGASVLITLLKPDDSLGLIDAPHEFTGVGERHAGAREARVVDIHPTQPNRCRHAPMARTRCRLGNQAAVRTSEVLDRLPGALQPLAEGGSFNAPRLRCLWNSPFEDLAGYIGDAVRSIEALKVRVSVLRVDTCPSA